MSRHALVALLLALGACSAPTAADKGRAIQGALAAGQAACLMLLADQSIPRDPSAVEYCTRMLAGCPEEP